MNYIKPTGQYYEGDREHVLDIEVPKRPSRFYIWDGSLWILDATLANEEQRKLDLDDSISQAPVVQTLKYMTNAEVNAWWTANVTSFAQASVILREVVKYLVRRI